MVQWINLLWYNSFVNGQQCFVKKLEPLALALLGLMAGWQMK